MSDQDWIDRLASQYGAKQAAALRGDETTFKAASFWLQETAEHHWHEIIAALRIPQGSIDMLERECNQLNDMTISQRLLIEDLASMCRRLSYSVKRSGNDKLAHQCVELLKKHDLGGSVIRTSDVPSYKYPETFCSQCGGEFGPGNEGFSHCKNHKHLPRLG